MDKLNRRPFVKARRWEWKEPGTSTQGIGLFRGQNIVAHFTPDEARIMADKLHDYADQTETASTKPTNQIIHASFSTTN